MKPGQRSRTAEAAAAVRASHHLHASPIIFDDPQAVHLTSPGWRVIVRSSVLNWLVTRVLLGSLRPISALILVRSRYAEEKLEAALQRGIDQYVIVGAGLDSFTLRRRDLEASLRVFEVDHRDTQQAKLRRLAELRTVMPRNVEYVSIDFEREDLASALRRSRYQLGRPAFFSWLGTTHYLPRDVTLRTLRSLATCSQPGSELVFDYSLPIESLSAEDVRSIRRLEKFTNRRSEPLIGHFDPDDLSRELRARGYSIIEDLSSAEQRNRYFTGRRDGLAPTPAGHLIHVRVGVAPNRPSRTGLSDSSGRGASQ